MPKIISAKTFPDRLTEKRIHEHLTNKADLISEADIKNVNAGVFGDGSKVAPEQSTGKTSEHKNDDDDVETPWNILES